MHYFETLVINGKLGIEGNLGNLASPLRNLRTTALIVPTDIELIGSKTEEIS